MSGMTNLAKLYQAHHAAYQEDIPFWLALADEFGGPIVEMGCGTGRVLLPLAGAGYICVGLDHAPEMLAVLKTQIEEGMAVEVVEGDFTAFNLDRQFPLVILPCNTYSTLNAEQRLAALECIKRHLAPGGCFALSIPNLEDVADSPGDPEPEVEEIFDHPETGYPVQVSSAWQREAGQIRVSWHYDHLLPDGKVERVSTEIRHWLTPLADYQREFESMGFVVEVFGGFNGEPYNSEALYMVIKAKFG